MTQNNDSFDLSNLRKKKGKINSGIKGKAFERKVCEMLNERFQTKDFMRTPGSGAFATAHTLPDHVVIYGDLITPLNFKFTIECKKGYNKESISSLFNDKSNFSEFIKQAEQDSKKANKELLIILAQDRQEPLALVRQQGFQNFISEFNEYAVLYKYNNLYLILKLKEILKLPTYTFFN